MALLGLGLLLFAGYAIVLHGRRLRPRKAITLLGEKTLTAGGPAAFRLIAWDFLQGRPLIVERIEMSLSRRSGLHKMLAYAIPGGSLVDLNVRLPGWPPGGAKLTLKLETDRGDAELSADVTLDSRATSRLRLVPPSVGLPKAPVLLRSGPARAHGEQEAAPAAGEPYRIVLFPAGGRFSNSLPSSMLVRIIDRTGRPLRGLFGLDEAQGRQTDAQGFVEVTLAERPDRLRLSFQSDAGSLAGGVTIERTPAQIDMALSGPLAAAGEELTVEMRTISASAPIYLDAWWRGGLCYSTRTTAHDGRARARLAVPAGIDGPLAIRARLDPFGDGPAVRDAAVMVGKDGRPEPGQALRRLMDLPAGPGFWDEVGMPANRPVGRAFLRALLSRVAPPDGPLPRLIDGQASEKKTVERHRRRVIMFGLWMVGLLSAIAWLVVIGMLLLGLRGASALQRRQARKAALLAGAVLGLVLAGGWFWLWWSAAGLL